MKVNEFLEMIRNWFEEPKDEEGLRFGNLEDEIKGIIICWMISNKVLNYAVKNNYNLIISHEDLFFPPEYAKGKGEGIISEKRKEILSKYRINFIRLHYIADKYFILDEFDKLIGGKVILKENFYRIYEFENINLYKLAGKIKKKFKVNSLRISGNYNEKVRKAGCLFGGLGLSINAFFIDKIISYKVDTVIAGEVDEYTIRALNDLKINIIEIGHEKSETPGLIKFSEFLKEKIPEIKIKYIKNPYPVKIFQ